MARDASSLHLLPADVQAKIVAMAKAGETAEAVALMLRTDHGMRRKPTTVRYSTPFCDGLRLRAVAEAEAAALTRIGDERRRADALARHWQHPQFPGVSLPRLSILADARA